jgi:hypothetical protein
MDGQIRYYAAVLFVGAAFAGAFAFALMLLARW